MNWMAINTKAKKIEKICHGAVPARNQTNCKFLRSAIFNLVGFFQITHQSNLIHVIFTQTNEILENRDVQPFSLIMYFCQLRKSGIANFTVLNLNVCNQPRDLSDVLDNRGAFQLLTLSVPGVRYKQILSRPGGLTLAYPGQAFIDYASKSSIML